MTFRPIAAVLLLCLGPAARAEDLPPEQVAKVKMEEQQAIEKVNAAHGNRKPSEMDPDERRQVIQEQKKASQEVLEHNGVSAKDYARATMNGEQRGKVEEATRALKEKQEAEKKQAAAAKEPKAEGQVVVEHGIPKDVQKELGAPPGAGSQHHGKSSGSNHKSKQSRKRRQDE